MFVFNVHKTFKVKSYRDLLVNIIPEALIKQLPSSYDIIGDVAIIELKDELLPYAKLIGKAILGFHKHVRSVYLKASGVKGAFRLRELKLIAGVDKEYTIHKEYGVRFYVKFKNVYFSPRLAEEHRRIAEQCKDGEVVVDMFSGVGGFALHIACLRNCIVYAIDINPHAIECMIKSIKLNFRRLRGVIIPVNMDVRDFARKMTGIADRVIMDLPERAISFLKEACLLLRDEGIIHFYQFVDMDKVERLMRDIREVLKGMQYEVKEVLHAKASKEIAPRVVKAVFDLRVRRV